MEHTQQLIAIGNLLRELRLFNGLTQEQLASEINITKRTIQRIEAGENVTVKSLIEILDWFDVDVINNYSK
ncbi:MAG: helix-turn-helix transcriptional regulator [Prolixibacteraceae bacterium]|nr:helix-turn-helix transcriptional regulator [Prolixibacteraceae bacterium]